VNTNGQDSSSLVLEIDCIECGSWKFSKEQPIKFDSELQARTYLTEELSRAFQAGHYAVSLDTMQCRDRQCTAKVFIGQLWKATSLILPDSISPFVEDRTLQELKRNDKLHPGDWKEVANLILESLGRNGYPFAEAMIDQFSDHDGEIKAVLKVNRGRQFYNNDIKLIDPTVIKQSFLSRYLEWERHSPYNHEHFLDYKKRLAELDFVKLESDPKVYFSHNKSDLELRLAKQRANQFDFILGILPANDFQDRSLLLSVYLKAILKNVLGGGERLSLNFSNTKPETQEMIIDLDHPYFMGMPFGILAGFELFKNQKTNLDVRYNLGMSYQKSKDILIKGYYRRIASSILDADTSFVLKNKVLPTNLDYVTNALGFDMDIQRLDFNRSPRKGWRVNFGFTAGVKKIKRNNDILRLEESGVPVGALYDSLDAEKIQFDIHSSLEFYQPLSDRLVLLLRTQGKSLLGLEAYLDNELFRLGGSRLLRGFDEEFFRSSTYLINTAELRFYIDQGSYFLAFYDAGYLSSERTQESTDFWAQGFGLGMTFQTDIGIFNLSYALGQADEIPLDLNAGKIHFGYVSLF
jgi:outer membrane protein assembly factor BamA